MFAFFLVDDNVVIPQGILLGTIIELSYPGLTGVSSRVVYFFRKLLQNRIYAETLSPLARISPPPGPQLVRKIYFVWGFYNFTFRRSPFVPLGFSGANLGGRLKNHHFQTKISWKIESVCAVWLRLRSSSFYVPKVADCPSWRSRWQFRRQIWTSLFWSKTLLP